MTPAEFTERYTIAFGEKAGLPLVFWYSDHPFAEPCKLPACLIGGLQEAREGKILSLNNKNLKCPGGLIHAGFCKPTPQLPGFISGIERYKQTEELAANYLSQFEHGQYADKWINFARIDKIETFDHVEGVIFYATADILAGLTGWGNYDHGESDLVVAPFGAGCSNLAYIIKENEIGGRRTFIGMFDPSARPYIEENSMTYSVPIKRFHEMCNSIDESFLIHQTPDWRKIRARINHE